ncbi:hypothetical protein [Vibrio porteresiae]|uniref:Uncharacterized protein n=1 Tax=Vibrio porteresiae DSM 19223 TaxID=1123496 RepID=A0ABZ0Q956_9VIBR|nr:hypothetical protein [Vibrio porteresiae]WPC72934.1 hypothetical protein R8Z52_12445 [Vibrio porteresiae DSM 19223]
MSVQEKSLLIVKLTTPLTLEQTDEIQDRINRGLADLNVACVICPLESEIQFHQPIGELIDALKNQTVALNNLASSNIAIVDEISAFQDEEPVDELKIPQTL